MELQVTITLSDRLFGLLEEKLPNLGRRVQRAVTKEIGEQTRKESEITISVMPPKPVAEIEEGVTVGVVAATETEPAQEPAQETMPEPAPEPAAADAIPTDPAKMAETIRQIMHRTRQRIEGEDYKDNTSSESYKKYHRKLNDTFVQIAMQLGFNKPSLIDSPEKIRAFADECDSLFIDNGGAITSKAPF